MTARDPRAALDAAHHLLWLASSDAQGDGEPYARKHGRSLVDRCARLALATECVDDRTDDERAVGYMRSALDLVALADADAPTQQTGRILAALQRAVKA